MYLSLNACDFLQVERFWLQSDVLVCVLAGVGLSQTHRELERRLGRGEMWKATSWVFTMALLAHMVQNNHRCAHLQTVIKLICYSKKNIWESTTHS